MKLAFSVVGLSALVAAVAVAQTTPAPAPAAAAPTQAGAPQKSLSQGFGLSVYPAKGQQPDVQNKDEYECYQWAKQNTGIDPLVPAAAPVPAAEQKGGTVKKAAGGAAVGAAVGAIAGDAGKGAAIGATAGGAKGIADKRRGEKAAAQQQATAQQQAAQSKEAFNKAFASCLEGRSYSVK